LSYGNKSITDTLVNTAFGEGVPEREPPPSSLATKVLLEISLLWNEPFEM
jgi:hypothetical protein